MDRRVFAILTAMVLLSLLFFYTRKTFKVYEIKIVGDEDFKDKVEKALRMEKVRYEIVSDSRVVFDQKSKTLTIDGVVYHLYWSDSILKDLKREIELLGLDVNDIRLIPKGGEMEVLKSAIEIVKTGYSENFSDGYLYLPIEVLDSSGDLLLRYDPKKMEFEYDLHGG